MDTRCNRGLFHYHVCRCIMYRIIFFLLLILLVPSACQPPTIQTDLYTWGYKNGEASYLGWVQCDFKDCETVNTCVTNTIDEHVLTYGSFYYDFDSLIFDKDCWTNECPDALYTYIYQ